MKNIFLILYILLYSLSFSQVWTSGADIPQGFRASNVAAYVNKNSNPESGFLFLISGRDANGNITPRNQRYDLTNNVWTDMAPAPTGILGASTAIVKDSIYIIGGLRTTPGISIRKVRKYSINENIWTDKADFPINIVDGDAVAYQDSLIYVTAGYNSRVRVFNTIKNRWRDATAMTSPLESIAWGALTVSGNKLVYMCGTDDFLSTNYFNTVRIGTIDQTDRANITWTSATPFPGQTRTFFDARTWENGLIMTGGSTDNTFGTNSNECYFYNVDADSWTQLQSKSTSWITGNSDSMLVNNQWKLICASGHNSTEYLINTEIFSSPLLGTDDFDTCNLHNFKFYKYSVNFCLDNSASLAIKIYNLNGLLVKEIESSYFQKGKNQVELNLKSLQNGIYLCKISGDSYSITKKIILN